MGGLANSMAGDNSKPRELTGAHGEEPACRQDARSVSGAQRTYRQGLQCHPGGGARSSACSRYYPPASSLQPPASSTNAEATRSPLRLVDK
jgi:hypothetical protein